MFDFEEKKNIKNIIYSKTSIVVVSILLILVMKSAWFAYQDEKSTRINKEIAENQLKELQDREGVLVESIANLKTEQGKEEEIRGKFSVVKEGEKMIMIIEPKDEGLRSQDKKEGIWNRFLKLFK